jgi:hypothetical protein
VETSIIHKGNILPLITVLLIIKLSLHFFQIFNEFSEQQLFSSVFQINRSIERTVSYTYSWDCEQYHEGVKGRGGKILIISNLGASLI